jgi:hypothetical protein
MVFFFFLTNAFIAEGKTLASVLTSYYVSPGGNDLNPGTKELPFATIQKARDIIRTVNSSMSGDIYVCLRGGAYYQTQTLIFDERDAGTNSYNIIYRNYSGEAPTISGGKVITGWTVYDTLNAIWRAPIGGLKIRQLYVNDSAATRARTDDSSSSWLLNVSKPSDVEVVRLISGGWAHDFLRIIPTNSGYTVKEPENTYYNNIAYYLQGKDLFFENDRVFIKNGGEWASNSQEEYVYYKPRTGEAMSAVVVVAPVCDPLITIRGSSTSNPDHHVSFFGITFAHSTWTLPSSAGFVQIYANQYYTGAKSIDFNAKRPSSGIWIENAHHVRIERCIIKDMGASAVDTYKGAHDISIVGNVVRDIGGNGICDCVAGIPESLLTVWGDSVFSPIDMRERCVNDTIANNFVTKCGKSYPGGEAIFCGYPTNIAIEHNEVTDLEYTGIDVGWGWADCDNAMHDNMVKNNLVYNVMKTLFDGGGIYTLSRQPGTTIAENYVYNVVRGNGIYTDQGSGGVDSLPFVVQCNVIGAVGLESYCRNIIGKIDFKTCSLPNSKITKNAGLEPEYIDIKTELPTVYEETRSLSAGGKSDSPHIVFIQRPTSVIIIIPSQKGPEQKVEIADLKGRIIKILTRSGQYPFARSLSWNYDDKGGRIVAEGLYLIRAVFDGKSISALLNVHF